MKIKLSELRQIVKSIIKEERAKRLINEVTKAVKDFPYEGGKYTGRLKDGKPDSGALFVNKHGIEIAWNFKNGVPVGMNPEKDNVFDIPMTWDELNNIKSEEEEEKLRVSKLGGTGRVYALTADFQPECQKYFDEAEKEPFYNPCNLLNNKYVLKYGSKGPIVKFLQCILNGDLGNEKPPYKISPLEIDGIYGNKTYQAVIKFQQSYNSWAPAQEKVQPIKVDGVFGNECVKAYKLTFGADWC